jgi:regulator of sirC expression with transglutaminase-like and TPR domain
MQSSIGGHAMKYEFNDLATLDDNDIDLVEAALVVAKDEYPALDIPRYLNQIDRFAADIEQRVGNDNDAQKIIATLNDYLFKEQGFRGNMENYYDPRNSLLNDVMDRRCGIPISLSIIYLETGRRLGLDLEGVSFPGHFLVRFNVSNGTIILDPFFGGISLSEDELEFRMSRFRDNEMGDSLEDLLEPASNKAIIERVLRNLRGIYMNNETHDKALKTSERILLLSPDNPYEYLFRGSIYHSMECHQAALDDYQRFLRLHPEADEAERIRGQIIELQGAVRRLH